jgi:hypothetical protein
MSEKTAKPKKSKAAAGKDQPGVLGNLPATRATRFGGERSRATAKAKPKAATKPKAAAKPKAATPRAAAKPRAAAPPVAAPPVAAAPAPRAPHRPRPIRAGAPALTESTERARAEASEPLERGSKPPSGTELVTTAIQAAGELAQIGLTVGGQVLKRAVKRLPKP